MKLSFWSILRTILAAPSIGSSDEMVLHHSRWSRPVKDPNHGILIPIQAECRSNFQLGDILGYHFFCLGSGKGVLDIHSNKKEPLGATKRVSQPHDSLYFGRLSITISHDQLLSNIIQLLSLLNHIKFFLFLLILTHFQLETTSDHPRIFLDSAHELDETYLVPRLGRNGGGMPMVIPHLVLPMQCCSKPFLK
jgi:hypothetical protein